MDQRAHPGTTVLNNRLRERRDRGEQLPCSSRRTRDLSVNAPSLCASETYRSSYESAIDVKDLVATKWVFVPTQSAKTRWECCQSWTGSVKRLRTARPGYRQVAEVARVELVEERLRRELELFASQIRGRSTAGRASGFGFWRDKRLGKSSYTYSAILNALELRVACKAMRCATGVSIRASTAQLDDLEFRKLPR